MSNKGGRVSVLVRMSPDMRDKIQRAARRNGVNAWMLDAISAHLGASDSTAKQPDKARQQAEQPKQTEQSSAGADDRIRISLPRELVQTAAGKADAKVWLMVQLQSLLSPQTTQSKANAKGGGT